MSDLIYLLKCAVTSQVPDKTEVEAMDLEAVLKEAERHMVDAACAMALESAGFKTSQTAGAIALACRRTAVLDHYLDEVKTALESAGIWYLPLKGSVLKDLYPRYGMRQMADVDVLIDPGRAADVRAAMEALGFETDEFGGGHHDTYRKKPYGNFEMHTSLFGTGHDETMTAYFSDVERRLLKEAGTAFGRLFSPEDFYLFLTAHACKHYRGRGIGVRHLMDLSVYLNRFGESLDWESVQSGLEALGIEAFERESRELALSLFGDENGQADLHSEEAASSDMLAFMEEAGAHGSRKARIRSGIARRGGGRRGRAAYVLSRLLPSKKDLSENHPVIYRSKVLIPFYAVFRLIRGLTVRRGRMREELAVLRESKEEEK